MNDGPKAISMHQPWASLVIYGIKRIEGRGWSTALRGRLWIHATSQIPSGETIQETEENFKQVWAIEGVCPVFPKHYPTSALLGCVDIHDCLRIEAVEAWPDIPESVKAEVGSPFCFLCDSPKRLLVPQRMSGSFKIWSFSTKLAKDLEPALRTPPQSLEPGLNLVGVSNLRNLVRLLQMAGSKDWELWLKVGSEPWSWRNFPVPDQLRYANLPRSDNSDKWNRRFGCAKEIPTPAIDSMSPQPEPQRSNLMADKERSAADEDWRWQRPAVPMKPRALQLSNSSGLEKLDDPFGGIKANSLRPRGALLSPATIILTPANSTPADGMCSPPLKAQPEQSPPQWPFQERSKDSGGNSPVAAMTAAEHLRRLHKIDLEPATSKVKKLNH